MKFYIIFDKKSTEYSCISMHVNDATFCRNVGNEVNAVTARTLLATNPSDFDLFCLGDFDIKSGKVSPDLRFICNAADLKESF